MKKQILLSLALASWWTLLLLGQSQTPPPTPSEHSEKKQDVSRIENAQSQPAYSPSETPAATLHQSTPIPTQSSADKKATVSDNPSAINWALILGIANTVLLLLFNGILAVVAVYQYQLTHKQADFSEKGLVETRRTADAAKASADATALTQRAVILLESVSSEPQLGREPGYYLQPISILVFTFRNYGATVANDVVVSGRALFQTHSFPIHGGKGVPVAPQGTNKWITHSIGNKLQGSDIESVNNIEGGLTYEVVVTYSDAFGKRHTYKATGRYIPLLKSFITGWSTAD